MNEPTHERFGPAEWVTDPSGMFFAALVETSPCAPQETLPSLE